MDLLQMADEKMYQDKRYKKQLQKNRYLAARRSMLAESISTDSLKEKFLRFSITEAKKAVRLSDDGCRQFSSDQQLLGL